MWRRKAWRASITLALIAATFIVASVKANAVPNNLDTAEETQIVNTQETFENNPVLETVAPTVETIPEETVQALTEPAFEEETEHIAETIPEETEEVIVETTEPEEVDPLAIIELEVQEDGTRILSFKNGGLYTVPKVVTRTEPMVSESGYVEKIVEFPHYLQQSYPRTNYGNHGTVSSHGCGITSCAMVYTYLLDREIYPDELAAEYGRFNTPVGSDYALFETSAADLGLEVTRSYIWEEVVEALENGCIVIANVRSDTIFTQGGHYIVYHGITEDGRILIKDPNIYNYGQWTHKGLSEGFKIGFDPKYVRYSFPCWIYSPKDIEEVASNAET